MYERSSFPKTPKWSRHLSRLNRFVQFDLPDEVKALAKTYDFDTAALAPLLDFRAREFKAVQYVKDFNGRCILLAPDKAADGQATFAPHVIVTASKLMGKKSTLIVARGAKDIEMWTAIILGQSKEGEEAIWVKPAKGVFGNIVNLTVDEPTHTWVIAVYSQVIDPTVVQQFNTDHLVVSRDSRHMPYEFQEVCEGLCSEIKSTTFLFESIDFWTETDTAAHASVLADVCDVLMDSLKMNMFTTRVALEIAHSLTSVSYFRKRGIKIEQNALLEASGVCFDLVLDKSSKHFKNLFSNSMLVTEAGHSNRRNDVIARYKEYEAKLTQAEGKTIEQIVDSALAGSEREQSVLELLKGQEWAKLKAHMFYNMIRNFNRNDDKTLIIARNDYIRKYMGISLQAIEIDDQQPDEIQKRLSSFVYPNLDFKTFETPKGFNPKMSNTIVCRDFKNVDERVLGVLERVVITEFDYDEQTTNDIIELSQVFKFKLFFGTMRGTFEEYMSDQLLASHY